MNLDSYKDKTILLLGKPRAFSQEEFDAQLASRHISVTKEPSDEVDTILEGRMMTPYEQNLSDELYEQGGFTFLEIDAFEEALARSIDDNVLLMSLKLSNDKERLKSFLQNSTISDELFFKLLEMYKWSGEDFFENDDNRDVTAALIGRFYENIERNHNVQYATTGLIHLVSQTQNPQLLEAISKLEPLGYHPKIKVLLAQHPQTPNKVLKKLLREADEAVLEAMSSNALLDKTIAKELIAMGEPYIRQIAQNIALDSELFKKLQAWSDDLAHNSSLDEAMQRALLENKSEAVLHGLAQNEALLGSVVETMLEDADDTIKALLFKNPAMAEQKLREAYANKELHYSLAQNSATPADILEALYRDGDEAILAALAANEATPVDILYQLQLDSRFERAVRTNAAFGKHIQSQNIGWLV
ncbi:MAG: hypothetical protein ABGW85_08405 [Sulfurimonas sp.]